MLAIDRFAPNWRELMIHESSPSTRGASVRLSRECKKYAPSQYLPGTTNGLIGSDGIRSEDLEALTFEDESLDLHVTQDVMEHIFRPDLAFREIARTLRPGGMHIFTVPLVRKLAKSARRARRNPLSRDVELLFPAEYHGNPVGDGRALVTIDWGFDICEYIFRCSGMYTYLTHIEDLNLGISAEYNEVLVSIKSSSDRILAL
jgi:SAM-dependent methyltransferase